MRHLLDCLAAMTVLLLCSAFVCGDEKPVESKPLISIGEMRIQTVPALTYLYVPAETSFAKMSEPVKAGFDKIFSAAAEAKLLLARPTVLVYQGSPHLHPEKDFKMEIGLIVADDTEAPAGLEKRKTAPFKCATILYTGPVADQGQAYQKLIPAMTAAGLTPTGEERELCLLWVGPDSVDNIFMMQVGIK